MAHRILIPLDGSSRAERAVPVVDRLAEALGAEVELLRVVDRDDDVLTSAAALTPEPVESRVRRAEDYLQDTVKRFRRVKPTATHVHRGPASKMIAAFARDGSFKLVVMSSHGETGLAGTLLGSVAREVVRESVIPVMILRVRVALPQEPRSLIVLVPLDGSTPSEAVLEPLIPLAQALDWRLLFFRVTDRRPRDSSDEDRVVPTDATVRRELPEVAGYLDELAERAQASGLQADVQIGFGDPGPCIVQCAKQAPADIIAMTTHARHGIGRLVLGSVTEYVLGHASVPVLTVRPLRAPVGRASIPATDEGEKSISHGTPSGLRVDGGNGHTLTHGHADRSPVTDSGKAREQ